jgi:Flp pilus assembly protein TadD
VRSLAELIGAENPTQGKDAARARVWNPERTQAFMLGQITLGDLEGVSKQEQYQIAEVGYSYLTSSKLDKAKVVFEGLVALDPYDAYFHTALGSIAQQSGDDAEAEARYSRALEINPFSPAALANRGEIRLMSGRLLDGAQDLLRAVEEDPNGREPATIRARATLQAVRDQLQSADLKAMVREAARKKAEEKAKAPGEPQERSMVGTRRPPPRPTARRPAKKK